MSTTYEETTATTHSSSEGIGFDRPYLTSWKGILKIVEIVLDLIAFICASVYMPWGPFGGGWVQFVTMAAFITTLLLFGFHLFGVIHKLPGPWGLIVLDLIAFICASVWIYWSSIGGAWVQFVTMAAFITTLLLFGFHLFRIIYKLPGPWGLIELIYYAIFSILLLIAAIVAAARGAYHSSIVATAIFTFACTACYVIDTFFLFRDWQQGRSGMSSSHSATTTTRTETHIETKVQY